MSRVQAKAKGTQETIYDEMEEAFQLIFRFNDTFISEDAEKYVIMRAKRSGETLTQEELNQRVDDLRKQWEKKHCRKSVETSDSDYVDSRTRKRKERTAPRAQATKRLQSKTPKASGDRKKPSSGKLKAPQSAAKTVSRPVVDMIDLVSASEPENNAQGPKKSMPQPSKAAAGSKTPMPMLLEAGASRRKSKKPLNLTDQDTKQMQKVLGEVLQQAVQKVQAMYKEHGVPYQIRTNETWKEIFEEQHAQGASPQKIHETVMLSNELCRLLDPDMAECLLDFENLPYQDQLRIYCVLHNSMFKYQFDADCLDQKPSPENRLYILKLFRKLHEQLQVMEAFDEDFLKARQKMVKAVEETLDKFDEKNKAVANHSISNPSPEEMRKLMEQQKEKKRKLQEERAKMKEDVLARTVWTEADGSSDRSDSEEDDEEEFDALDAKEDDEEEFDALDAKEDDEEEFDALDSEVGEGQEVDEGSLDDN